MMNNMFGYLEVSVIQQCWNLLLVQNDWTASY